jgi:hypothetical protein
MGPRVGLNGYKEEKISYLHRVSNPEAYSLSRFVAFDLGEDYICEILVFMLNSNTFSFPVCRHKCKGKAVPLQAWSGPEVSRKLRFPDFMTTAPDGGQPYAPAAFTPRKYTWYSFLLEAESTPGP